jgi:hypothetical protein
MLLNDDFKLPTEVLSNGLLCHGRCTKRLALELSAAMEPFLQQYKLVRYEKWPYRIVGQWINAKQKNAVAPMPRHVIGATATTTTIASARMI